MSKFAPKAAQLVREGISKSRIATEANISENSLKGFEDDSWNPQRKTIEAVEAAAERIIGRIAGGAE